MNATVVETGKLRYDVVVHRLTAQAANQAALVGRAKDLLGVAGISATITGALLNDKLLSTDPKEPISVDVLLLGALALLMVIVPGIWVMRPQSWAFSFDPVEFTAETRKDDLDSQNDLYHFLANTYTNPDAQSGKTPLARNDEKLARMGVLVTVQAFGIGLLALSGFLLVLHAS